MLRYITFTLVVLLSCSHITSNAQNRREAKRLSNTARKALNKRNFNRALEYSCYAITGDLKKKRHQNTLGILKESYAKFNRTSKERLGHLLRDTKEYKGEITIKQNQEIITILSNITNRQEQLKNMPSDILRKCGIHISSFEDYAEDIQLAEQKYASAVSKYVSEQYILGDMLMNEGSKSAALNAYVHFSNIIHYKRDYMDAVARMAQAKKMATYKVAILGFQNDTWRESNCIFEQPLNEGLQVQIAQRFHPIWGKGLDIKDFIKINYMPSAHHPRELRNKYALQEIAQDLAADILIFGRISRLDASVELLEPEMETIEKEITLEDGSKAKATAQLYTHQRNYDAITQVVYSFYNAYQNYYPRQEAKIIGRDHWFESWKTYEGDESALSKTDREAALQKPPRVLHKEDVAIHAINDASQILCGEILQQLHLIFDD